MNKASEIMSEITVHMKYARYLSTKNRRETWDELVSRNYNMHLEKINNLDIDDTNQSPIVTRLELKEWLHDSYEYVFDKKVLPSMRSLQFAGKPIALSPNICLLIT